MALKITRPGDHKYEPFEVDYANVSLDDAQNLARVVDAAADERSVQTYLAANPTLLSAHLNGGHGRWVRPQVRLGAQYVADFLICEKDSMGMHWTLVELENPTSRMCLKAGGFAQQARTGMDQIDAWRDWIGKNHSYATKTLEEQGLGLKELDPHPPGLVLVGRREVLNQNSKQARRTAKADRRIEVHTYDWLIEQVEVAARTFEASRLRRAAI